MFRKFIPFALTLILLGTACSQSTLAVTPVSTAQVQSAVTPTAVLLPVVTTVSTAVPKHGDLTFIEFFAVT